MSENLAIQETSTTSEDVTDNSTIEPEKSDTSFLVEPEADVTEADVKKSFEKPEVSQEDDLTEDIKKKLMDKGVLDEKGVFNPAKLAKMYVDLETYLGKRETEALSKKDEELTSLKRELELTKSVLEKTTGINDLAQLDLYKRQMEINNAYQYKQIQALRKYFDIPNNSQAEYETCVGIMNNLKENLANLNPVDAASLVAELKDLEVKTSAELATVNSKQSEILKNINQATRQKVTEILTSDAELPEIIKNEAKTTLDLFANDLEGLGLKLNPKYFESAIGHFKERDKKIFQAGIEEGKKQAQLTQQNEADKGQLVSGAGSSSAGNSTGKIWTRAEIDAMSLEDFEKHEKEITRQVKLGLIK